MKRLQGFSFSGLPRLMLVNNQSQLERCNPECLLSHILLTLNFVQLVRLDLHFITFLRCL